MHHDYVGAANAANDRRRDDEKSRFLIIPLEKAIKLDILKLHDGKAPSIIEITVEVGQGVIVSHAVYHRTGFTNMEDHNLRIHVSLTLTDEDQSNDELEYLIAPFHLKDIKLTPSEVKETGLKINKEDLHEDVQSLRCDVEDDCDEEHEETHLKKRKKPAGSATKESIAPARKKGKGPSSKHSKAASGRKAKGHQTKSSKK